MARRYRRYRRRRTYYRRKRWTAYNSEVTIPSNVNLAAGYFKEVQVAGVYGSATSLGVGAVAATNAAINYYVCRARFKGVIAQPVDSGVTYIVYIGFIPNAVTINDQQQQNDSLYGSFFYKHPEYVLAWTRLDNIADTGDSGEVSLYSRITKRVCPGDLIVVGTIIKNVTSGAIDTAGIVGTFSCYLRTN